MSDLMTATKMCLTDLSVSIGRKQIVSDVSFEISTGDWVCIIGPNGAGKSSLLKAIAGILPSSGQMQVNDFDLAELSHRDRACWIAYVAQNPIIPAGMTVFDYVMLGRTAHLKMLASESDFDIEMTNFVLTELGLAEFAAREVASMSGGERQRVTIARALNQASPIVLLDEPTSALDIGFQQEVLTLIDRLRREQKIAVISTMHDLTTSGIYPDRLMLLADGKVQVSGTANDVLTPGNISAFYGANVRVINDFGRPIVVPTDF
ncbi:MAG: ABC transporter ATP-binding protein [Actinomycetales bacterium]|nr:ABC transporter ATP-binding protein [Actinomycetales bacterium]